MSAGLDAKEEELKKLDAKKEELKKLSDDVAAVQKQFSQYRSWTRIIDALIILASVTMTLSLVTLPMPHSVFVGVGCVIALIAIFRTWGARRRQMSDAVQAVEGRVNAADLALHPEP